VKQPKPKPLSWKARRRGATYCAPACGGGCTKAAYDQAQADAKRLQAIMGSEWEPRVWENLGWHFEVRWRGNTERLFGLRISPTYYQRRKIRGYMCFMGGMSVGDGKTPWAALRAAVKIDRADIDERLAPLLAAEAMLAARSSKSKGRS
jgi:hypothetical protein